MSMDFVDARVREIVDGLVDYEENAYIDTLGDIVDALKERIFEARMTSLNRHPHSVVCPCNTPQMKGPCPFLT